MSSPARARIRQAVAAAVGAFGPGGCAGRVAQEFGVHPDGAAGRVRWARTRAAEVFKG
ncbi:MAG TPA: hypothetical protein VHJ18_18090 [Streptosporangiaceae bacterium]|nr:hypothetical protein [Streptosporangiaceae bacterium]